MPTGCAMRVNSSIDHQKIADSESALTTRRKLLALGGSAGLCLAFSRSGFAQSAASYDYYISPTGSDSNPGTIDRPWSIGALNSRRSMYAGKRVGLLNGNYPVHGVPLSIGGGNRPHLEVQGGSPGSPTVVQSVNPLGAVLNLKNGSTRSQYGAIGQSVGGPPQGYIELRDLRVTGGTIAGIVFNVSQYVEGVVIEGCEIDDIYYPTVGDNAAGIWIGGCRSAVIRNCLIYNCKNNTGSHNGCGVQLWGARRTIIEHCTISDCGSGVYDKNNGGQPRPNEGTVVRHCHLHNNKTAMFGFTNAFRSGTMPYDPAHVHNNVIESSLSGSVAFTTGSERLGAALHFYNNTLSFTASVGEGLLKFPADSVGLVSFYNNIVQRTNSSIGYLGDIALGVGGALLAGYNCFDVPQFRAVNLPLGDAGSNPINFSSLLAWLASGISGLGNIQANPGFVSQGTGPERYRLQPSSPCASTGRVGGVLSGAAVQMGAWNNASSIGYIAGAAAIRPQPPILSIG